MSQEKLDELLELCTQYIKSAKGKLAKEKKVELKKIKTIFKLSKRAKKMAIKGKPKDRIKKKLKAELEIWLDAQRSVAKKAITNTPHKQFNNSVGGKVGAALIAKNEDGLLYGVTKLLKETFIKNVKDKYSLEDVQRAWETTIDQVKSSLDSNIDTYVLAFLLGIDDETIKKKASRIKKKGELALSLRDIDFLEGVVSTKIKTKFPTTENLKKAFDKSFATFFTPDPNEKKVSMQSIETKCRATLESILDKAITAINGIDPSKYSEVQLEELKTTLKEGFEAKIVDDFYFGRQIYLSFQKEINSSDPKTVYKHWATTLDNLKVDENWIKSIASKVCVATGKVSAMETLGDEISITQTVLDEIDAKISELFKYLPTATELKTMFEKHSVEKKIIAPSIDPSPIPRTNDSITLEDIKAEFIQSLTIWCNGALGAITDVAGALNVATPKGQQAASWWQFGGELITSIGGPLLKAGGKIAIGVGNSIFSTFARNIGKAKDRKGKVSLGKVMSSWRSSIEQYMNDTKLQNELFELFKEQHKGKTNGELLNEAKRFRGIMPSRSDLKTAILGTLDSGNIGEVSLTTHCVVSFAKENPLKTIRRGKPINNLPKIERINIQANFFQEAEVSQETALGLMGIYGDQTNIFKTAAVVEANVTFIDFRQQEICKVKFTQLNGGVQIGKSERDINTFKFKFSKEELSLLWQKFIAKAKTDNVFSIAKITE